MFKMYCVTLTWQLVHGNLMVCTLQYFLCCRRSKHLTQKPTTIWLENSGIVLTAVVRDYEHQNNDAIFPQIRLLDKTTFSTYTILIHVMETYERVRGRMLAANLLLHFGNKVWIYNPALCRTRNV